jgi:hypothetical protein
MSISERVEKTVSECEANLAENQSFIELKTFYEEMKRKGLVLKREYDLPPLDTIGRGMFTADIQRLRR